METFEVVSQVEVGRIYQFEPYAIYDNHSYEFQADITIQTDLDDMTTKQLPAVPGISRACFLQIRLQLVVIQNGVILLIDLTTLEMNSVCLLPFDITEAAIFPFQGKNLGIIHEDDFFVVNLQTFEMTAQQKTINSQLCFQTVDGIFFLQKRSAGLLNDKVVYLKRFRGSVQKAYPLIKQNEMILVDDFGVVSKIKGDFSKHLENIQQFTITASKKQPMINFVTIRDRYDIFIELMAEYIKEFENNSELVKTERQMLYCCSKITELIRAVNVREICKMKTDCKKRVLEIIKQSMQEFNSKQLDMQNQIQAKQTQLRQLNERICEKKQKIAELQRVDPEFEMKKYMHQMEQFKLEQMRKIDEELQQNLQNITQMQPEMKKVANNLAELAKQHLQERRRQIEEKRQQEEELKKQKEQMERVTRELQEAEEKRRQDELEQLSRTQREEEEQKRLQKQEEARKRYEEDQLKEKLQREKEQQEKQRQKEIEEQRKKEIEQDKLNEQKKASKKNVEVHEYELLSHGPSATFIINQQEAIVRQGCYLMKINFFIFRVETMLCTVQYTGQPCAYFQNTYYEFGEQNFKVNSKFELENLQIEMDSSISFCQQREKLFLLQSQKTIIFDLVQQKVIQELENVFDKAFLTAEMIFVKGESAFKLFNGVFTQIEFLECYKRKQVKQTNGKIISIKDNKLFINEEQQFASVHTLELGQCCCIGKYIMMVDDSGVFLTIRIKDEPK